MGPRTNNRIFAKSVQLIGSDGKNIGIMPTPQALSMAQDAGLDLVEINGASVPPVVKIMDFGKFKYEQKKKASESKRNQKASELKEIWVAPFIEENDLRIKLKKVDEFLAGGSKVKISAMIRGDKRVLKNRDAINAMFDKVLAILDDRVVLESRSRPDEFRKNIVVAPK
ncbi:MAG: translation initiation factor IF-3 [Rickettsiales bacterium]|jgi:translation initiation factor IF-3|nr:translation initiation factor IF-3 [Rickettsiales bacterium]